MIDEQSVKNSINSNILRDPDILRNIQISESLEKAKTLCLEFIKDIDKGKFVNRLTKEDLRRERIL